ncbi:MAG TPA: SRPBCC domain-containing protein [Flavihumibacter sp.]
MEKKTRVIAEAGKQEMLITREFELPLDLLFKAYAEPELLEEWMGTKVVKLENRPQGSWHFQTRDKEGNIVFEGFGVIHEFEPEKKLTRTFEMANAGLGPQLEFFEFEALSEDKSRLTMHIIFRSVAHRDKMIEFGMDWGINMAHNQLQKVAEKKLHH